MATFVKLTSADSGGYERWVQVSKARYIERLEVNTYISFGIGDYIAVKEKPEEIFDLAGNIEMEEEIDDPRMDLIHSLANSVKVDDPRMDLLRSLASGTKINDPRMGNV